MISQSREPKTPKRAGANVEHTWGTYSGEIKGFKFESKADKPSCPPATQDIALNLKNRKSAIDKAMYGPVNPNEPNTDYWKKLADEWKIDPNEAKKQRCGNCIMFIRSPRMVSCIKDSLGNEKGNDAMDIVDAGQLGYCEAFDFKCAAKRTCRAWVVGGPITTDKKEKK